MYSKLLAPSTTQLQLHSTPSPILLLPYLVKLPGARYSNLAPSTLLRTKPAQSKDADHPRRFDGTRKWGKRLVMKGQYLVYDKLGPLKIILSIRPSPIHTLIHSSSIGHNRKTKDTRQKKRTSWLKTGTHWIILFKKKAWGANLQKSHKIERKPISIYREPLASSINW